MLRDYIRLNQSMFAAFAVSLPLSALAAEWLSGHPSHLNAAYTTVVDYAAYLGTFGFVFYITNRHRYVKNLDGSRDADPLSDLKRILASLGIGEVIYGLVRWILQYYLLDAWQYEPYTSSVVAQVVAIAVYVVVMNVSVKVTRLYEKR